MEFQNIWVGAQGVLDTNSVPFFPVVTAFPEYSINYITTVLGARTATASHLSLQLAGKRCNATLTMHGTVTIFTSTLDIMYPWPATDSFTQAVRRVLESP